jgi:sulfate adenylyltransferase subunit 1 (EFTu-like GTPase family)
VRQLEATVCWLAEQPLVPGRYLLKHGTRTTRAEVRATGVLDVTSSQLRPADSLALNDIGRVAVRTAEPLPLDDYARNRRTGAFVLIDELSGATVAAGMAGNLPWDAV